MKLYYILLYLFILTSCDSNSKKVVSIKETINIGEGKTIKLSKLIKSFEYITIQDKEIIGNIFNLKIENNEFYIHDNVSKSILKYDSLGNFKYRIHRIGKGPGEYVMISDFLVKNDKVEILNIGNHKKNNFNENGEFINDSKFNSFGWRHVYLNDLTVLSYNMPGGISKEKDYLYLWNKKITKVNNKKISFLPYKDKILPGNLYPFSKYNSNINFCADFSNTVYSVNEKGEMESKYKLNFTHYKWATEDVYKKLYKKNIYEWSNGMKPYVQFLRFIESENYCYTGFYIEGMRKNSFYNKNDKTNDCANEFVDDIGLGTNNFEIVGYSNKNWYAILRISEMDNLKTLEERNQSVSENSEFIILKFKLH